MREKVATFSKKHTFSSGSKIQKPPKNHLLSKDLRKNYDLYLMLVPVILFYLIFKYWPMYGVQIAFRDYNPGLGFTGSEWVGLDNFARLFRSFRFGRMVLNTLLINIYQLIFQFPIPIFFAILVNEIRIKKFKKFVLNITYIPHFLSMVVVIGLLSAMVDPETGIINHLIVALGGEKIRFLESPEWFKTLFVTSGIWQNTGWDSLIYLGALAAIDPSLYEAAEMDGASKLQQIFRITIPCIVPTIMIMFILKVGGIMDLGVDKALLMQNDLNIASSDVLSVYVYQTGIKEGDYSFAAAVDLFNNTINFILLMITNKLSRKFSGSSLW